MFDDAGLISNSTDTVNVLVKNANQAPTASDVQVTTNQNVTADDIECRVADPDGAESSQPLTYTIVQQPKNGTLSLPLTTNTFFESDSISGGQEVPPLGSSNTTASGGGIFSYHDNSGMLKYNITYGGLSSQEIGAHIHTGAVGSEGPIAFTLPGGTTKTGEVGPLTQQQRQDLFNGNMYVNIHSSQYPDGEIRDQIKYNGTGIAKTSYTPDSEFSGNDTFTYKVSDGDLESVNEGIVTITVRPANQPPIADAGMDFAVDENTTGVVLNGTNSTDPDTDTAGDTIASYTWIQTEGPPVALEEPTISTPTFTSPFVDEDTILSFNLTVTDNSGLASINPASVNVTVRNVDQLLSPIVTISPTNQTVDENTTGVSLSGVGSHDPDGGNIVSYLWEQIAGPTITLNSTSSPIVTI